MLESKFGSPRIVNDGVTVAKEVDLEDAVENIGAKLVRQVGTLVLSLRMDLKLARGCGRHWSAEYEWSRQERERKGKGSGPA